MNHPIRLLVVADSEDDFRFIVDTLKSRELSVIPQKVSSEKEMRSALESPWNIVISYFVIKGFGGLKALNLLKERWPDTPFIMVSGSVSEDTAVQAMKTGASDYITKENFSRLIPSIEKELIGVSSRQRQREMADAVKEKEDQIRQGQKMEALGRLAGGIAHDFNNILSIMLMTCESAMLKAPEGSPVREDLEIINRAAERAATLTRQLLGFTRKQVLELKLININDIILEMENMLRRFIGDTIKFSITLDSHLSHCELDGGQIHQVLLNTVLNARDAMPKGGTLTIETHTVTLDQEFTNGTPWMKPGPYVQLLIGDTGVGIPDDILPKIFDPFFTTKALNHGTGLGLFNTYGIIKQSGGSVFVTSKVGEGTTFKIYFPVSQKEIEKAPPAVSPSLVKKSRGIILLVEDEVELRQALKLHLERFGLSVIEVECAKDALNIIKSKKEKIDLMVVDVVMPDMNGPDLVKAIREIQPNIKTLLTSGYLADTMEKYGVVTDFSPFISKPFRADDFIAKVKSILETDSPLVSETSLSTAKKMD